MRHLVNAGCARQRAARHGKRSGRDRGRSSCTLRAVKVDSPAVTVPTTRRQLVARHTGTPRNVLHVISSPIPDLEDEQVLVQMKYLGVNGGHDTFVCLGLHIGAANKGKTEFPVGAEGAGVVVATGSAVTQFSPGDAVGVNYAQYCDYAITPQRFLTKVPEATPEVAATALSGLFGCVVVNSAAEIEPGQTVFVTSGAGAAGSFIVQFARIAGARVLASVGTDAKAAVVAGLGAEPVNYHEADVGGALSAACPEGLDWVVDGVGGALQDTLIAHMRPGATLLQIGYISEYPHTGASPREREGRPSNEVSMWSNEPVDLGDGKTLTSKIWPEGMKGVPEYRALAFEKLAAGELQAIVDPTEFRGLDSAVDAIEYMLTGASTGKVVVRL